MSTSRWNNLYMIKSFNATQIKQVAAGVNSSLFYVDDKLLMCGRQFDDTISAIPVEIEIDSAIKHILIRDTRVAYQTQTTFFLYNFANKKETSILSYMSKIAMSKEGIILFNGTLAITEYAAPPIYMSDGRIAGYVLGGTLACFVITFIVYFVSGCCRKMVLRNRFVKMKKEMKKKQHDKLISNVLATK